MVHFVDRIPGKQECPLRSKAKGGRSIQVDSLADREVIVRAAPGREKRHLIRTEASVNRSRICTYDDRCTLIDIDIAGEKFCVR